MAAAISRRPISAASRMRRPSWEYASCRALARRLSREAVESGMRCSLKDNGAANKAAAEWFFSQRPTNPHTVA